MKLLFLISLAFSAPHLKTWTISTDVTGGVVNTSRLDQELSDSGCVTDYDGIHVNTTDVCVHGSVFANESLCDTTVQDHVAVILQDIKDLKHGAINMKTNELVAAGFNFDGNTFSLSPSARENWNTLKNAEDDFTWPVEVTTLTHDAYLLQQGSLASFWGTGMVVMKGHLDTGRDLNDDVHDCANQACVDAVTDNR